MPATPSPQKVFVAMSGGVDSSVAALLLVRAGYNVIGVFMKPWQPAGVACMWQRDREDAMRVAHALGIPFETWDVSRAYASSVSRPMVAAYRAGRTPNPDIECNRHIKFGLFYERAMRRGASYIATGHYARIVYRNGRYSLRTSADANKDQTYFLWKLRQSQLPHILFPVGGLRKPVVRQLAAAAKLPTAEKKDSQGVCFVGPMDMKSFLASVIKPKRGRIVHIDGRILGYHDGAGYYTIGQRHGLNIREGGGPYYVLRKNMKANTVTVGPATLLDRHRVMIRKPVWIGTRGRAPLRASIRYRMKPVPVRIDGSTLRFRRPVSAVASGQSVVFYQGTRLAGGAIVR